MRRMDYVHINGEGELIERPTGSLVDYSAYADLERKAAERLSNSLTDVHHAWANERTEWAARIEKLEAAKLPDGLSITSGSDGVWFHFDNGQGQKAMLNIAQVVQESYVIRAAVTGWAERFAAQREVSK